MGSEGGGIGLQWRHRRARAGEGEPRLRLAWVDKVYARISMLSIAVNHEIGADTLMPVMRVIRPLTGQRSNDRCSGGKIA